MWSKFKLILCADTVALLVLTLWPLILYWPVTLGHKVFFDTDLVWLLGPLRIELGRALAEGRLPLWTPDIQAGYPLFAEGEIAALYPINIFFHALLPGYQALSYTILYNMIFAAIGMYLFCRALEFRVPNAFIGGFTFAYGGFFSVHIPHVPHLTVASWLPWTLLFQHQYWTAKQAGKNSLLWFLFTSFAISLQLLGGFPQFTLFNLLVYSLFGCLSPWIWQSGKETAGITPKLAQLPQAMSITVLSMCLGLSIAAIQILPTWELTGWSVRAKELGEEFFQSFSLEPIALTQFIAPLFWIKEPAGSNMEFWGYVGTLPLFFALCAPIFRRDSRTMLIFVIGLVALVLALGKYTPVHNLLYMVPLFNRFRVPARFLFLVTFALAFLATVGAEEFSARLPHTSKKFIPIIGFALITVQSLLVYFAYNLSPDYWKDLWQFGLPVIFSLISASILALAVLRFVSQTIWQALMLGIVILNLGAFSAILLPNLAGMSSIAEIMQIPRTVLAMDETSPVYRVYTVRNPWTPAATRATLWANLALAYQKQSAHSYLPSLGLRRNEEYVKEMSVAMQDLLNIRYYLVPLEIPGYGYGFPPPIDDTEPSGGLTVDLLRGHPQIEPRRIVQIQLTSYTDQTIKLENGFLVGEIILGGDGGLVRTLPLRLGIETADWALEGFAKVQTVMQKRLPTQRNFPAYHKAVGNTFDGHTYITRFDVSENSLPFTVSTIGIRSFLPEGELGIEQILLIDASGQTASLAQLLGLHEYALAFRSHTAAMWENQNMLPRAFVVSQAERLDDADVLAEMRQPDFNPRQMVLLTDSVAEGLAVSSEVADPRARTDIIEYTSDHIVIQVQNERAGYLVLTDSWYPGWAASVDQKVVPIYRADYIFRAIQLAPGTHRVVFEYHPLSFTIGALISVLSLFFCVFLVAYSLFKMGTS